MAKKPTKHKTTKRKLKVKENGKTKEPMNGHRWKGKRGK